MKLLSTLFVLVVMSPVVHAKEGPCVRKLLATADRMQNSEEFTVYIEMLLENRILNTQMLDHFVQRLEKNDLINPIQNPADNQAFAFHYNEFQKLLSSNSLDITLIKRKVNDSLEKAKAVDSQKSNTEQNSVEIPDYISQKGYRFFKILHPTLGEAYKILRPKGHAENEWDWLSVIWPAHMLYNQEKPGFLMNLFNSGESDPLDASFVSPRTPARKACLDLEGGADLPSLSEYVELLQCFDHAKNKNHKVILTPKGELEFQKMFPFSYDKPFWTKSIDENVASKAWKLEGHWMEPRDRRLPGLIRCVSPFKSGVMR